MKGSAMSDEQGRKAPVFENECFFITPIGEKDSPERRRMQNTEAIVKRVCESVELTSVSAMDVEISGHISRQVVEHLTEARMAIADLTSTNPNVMYEIAIRHTANLPVILLAAEGTPLPFDINQERVVFFDETQPLEVEKAVLRLTAQVKAALEGDFESPVVSAVEIASYRHGSDTNKLLVGLIDEVAGLSSLIDDLDASARAQRDRYSGSYTAPRLIGDTAGYYMPTPVLGGLDVGSYTISPSTGRAVFDVSTGTVKFIPKEGPPGSGGEGTDDPSLDP